MKAKILWCNSVIWDGFACMLLWQNRQNCENAFNGSWFFRVTTCKYLDEQLNHVIHELDGNQLFQISIDDAIVNVNVLDEIEWIEEEQHQLDSIGSCRLPTLLNFKAGVVGILKSCSEELSVFFMILQLERKDFTKETETIVFPLFICATRYLVFFIVSVLAIVFKFCF